MGESASSGGSSGSSLAWRDSLRTTSSDRREADDGVARAASAAEAHTVRRTVPNTPEIFDDSYLSNDEPHNAFHRKADEIRRELQEFCTLDLGQLLQLPVPRKERESQFGCMNERLAQTKIGRNKISSPDHRH